MKRILLTCGVVCFLASCGSNTPKQAEQPAEAPVEVNAVEKQKACCPEMQAVMDNFAKWGELNDEQKTQAIVDAKALADKKLAEMKAKCEAEAANMTEEMAAKKAECKANCEKAWAEFENMCLDGKKAFLENFFSHKCCEHKCNHEGDHKCDQKCNHEGDHKCEQKCDQKCNHEGDHKCDHKCDQKCNHEGELKCEKKCDQKCEKKFKKEAGEKCDQKCKKEAK